MIVGHKNGWNVYFMGAHRHQWWGPFNNQFHTQSIKLVGVWISLKTDPSSVDICSLFPKSIQLLNRRYILQSFMQRRSCVKSMLQLAFALLSKEARERGARRPCIIWDTFTNSNFGGCVWITENGIIMPCRTFIFIDINIHLYLSIQFSLNFIVLVNVFKRASKNWNLSIVKRETWAYRWEWDAI